MLTCSTGALSAFVLQLSFYGDSELRKVGPRVKLRLRYPPANPHSTTRNSSLVGRRALQVRSQR
jgi:hypothetical protein